MTILNITIGLDRSFAFISTDTFVASEPSGPVDSHVTADLARAAESTFIGDGTTPEDKPLAFATKIFALPHLNAVMAGIGALAPILTAAGALFATPPDVFGFKKAADFASQMLPRVALVHPGQAFNIALVGWIEPLKRAEGAVWGSADGLRRIDIGPGHTAHPAPDTDATDYERLFSAWSPGVKGVDTERFHRLLVANQVAAYRAGKFARGAAVGGHLVTCRLDAAGIRMARSNVD